MIIIVQTNIVRLKINDKFDCILIANFTNVLICIVLKKIALYGVGNLNKKIRDNNFVKNSTFNPNFP